MPVINPFGVVAGTLSAGTTKATLGEAVFSNSNGVSFGINGQTITASVAAGGGGNIGSISAGTTNATLGEVVFSNSNGLTFGLNGQTITGSYTVPSVAGLLSNINVSGGTTSNNLSNIVFSNSNNVSFGLDGSTITASASIATSLSNINVSAGTTSNNLSALTFSNGSNVSFGLNGSVVTASVATSLTGVNISAGTTSNNLSAVTFANSNGMTFGLNASTITASHNGLTSQTNQTVGLYAAGNTTGQSSSSTFDARTISLVGQGIVSVGYSNGSVNVSAVQSVQTQGFSNTLGMSNLGNTSGTSGVISGTGLQYLFAGGPNITLSQSINGQSVTLTISGGAGGAGNTGSISAGTTRLTLGEAVFSNINGVSFGVDGQTVTASIATSLTAVNISAGTTSNNLSAFTFSNGSNVSFGLNGSVITASVATSLTAVNVSAGTTSNNLSAITFSNLNGVTFGLNGSVVTASVAAGGGLTNINVSAGTTSNNLSAITFDNANGISFGLNASTITASYTVPTVTNSSWTVSDAATSGTVARLAFTNLNGVTLSLSSGAAGSHTIVGSVATSLTNIRVSAGTTSNNLSAITFSNGSNVSFGLNGSVITASVNTSLTAINVSAGTTSNNLSALTFSNGSNVSFGLNGSVVTASVNTSLTAINVSAGTTSNNLSAITFSNLNGLTFGLNGSVITGSYTVPGTLSVFAQSNTTQSSSGTIPFSSLMFNGAGIASVGISNGSVVISVPAGGGAGDGGVFAGVSDLGNTAGSTGTVSTGNFVLVGSNGISLSQSTGAAGSAATVTIYGAVVSQYNNGPAITAAGSVAANSSASIIPFRLDQQVSASQMRFYVSISVLSTTNTSSAGFNIGWSGVIYSNNAGTLSSINSFSNSTSTFHQSNSTSSVGNVRALTATLATASLFTPGQYWMILNVTTTTSGAISLAKSVSMGVIPTWASGFGVANYLGNNTTNTRGVQPGLAIHSTGATRATLAFTDITGHVGNSASLANVWFEMNNGTIW
jgi:hypothetical protein